MRRTLAAFALFAAALAVGAAQSPGRLVFTNVRLLDTAAGRLRPVAALVVEGQKIAAIHTKAPADPLEGAAIRDLQGAILVPALADLSVQTQPGLDIDVDYFYAMSLAHGVLHLRAVDAHLPWAVAQRSRIASGEVLAPRVWTSGPMVDMRTPLGNRSQPVLGGGLLPLLRVPDAAALGREVRQQAGQGVDWVRLGDNVPVEAARAANTAARGARIRVSLSAVATSMAQAAQVGIPLIDGLGLPLRPATGLDTAPAAKQPAPSAPLLVETAWAQMTDADRRALITQLRRSGTAVAPMLTSLEIQRGALPEVDRDLAFLPERLRPPIQGRFVAAAQLDSKIRSQARSRQAEFLREFVQAGGRVATASGAQAEGWPIPGVAIHREIATFTSLGISPIDAIRSATVVAGEVLGRPRPATWQVGAAADFFVVRRDPLQDVGALTDIVVVVRAGEQLDREQLLRQARRATRERR
jgi:hypothetical protein